MSFIAISSYWSVSGEREICKQLFIESQLLVVCTSILKVSCQQYTNLVWFYTLTYRCFKIYSDWTKFHEELNFLKQVFLSFVIYW